ncbi:Polyketide cyclase / dehydrase and lipid transport [Rhizobiales bacterium GAS113]|nr:Polyketide cyclase / dehydrase and lipid transport [Rhizobiales bacterium GAS113]
MLAAIVIIIILVAALLAYGATRPANFHVKRSGRIKAPPAKIFPFISDLRGWGAWSPFEKWDPAMKRTFSGAADGKGAVYEWDGNRRAGAGRREITDTSPPFKIVIKLDFKRPIEGTTSPSSLWSPKATRRMSPGPCMVPRPLSRRSCPCSAAWTR